MWNSSLLRTNAHEHPPITDATPAITTSAGHPVTYVRGPALAFPALLHFGPKARRTLLAHQALHVRSVVRGPLLILVVAVGGTHEHNVQVCLIGLRNGPLEGVKFLPQVLDQ